MEKALIVASIGAFIGFEKNNIKILKNMGYEVTVACNKNGYEEYLKQFDVNVINIPFSRSPIRIDNIKAYHQLKKLINDEKYKIIHCHTPVGGAVTRFASKYARSKYKTNVIYTAHGFHFFKGSPIKNWLLFYPIEKYLSKYTDNLITINKEDFSFAKAKMKTKNIYYIPGVGVDVSRFFRSSLKIDKNMRKELGIPMDAFVILSVGELNENKNQETIIKALSQIDDNNIYYLICGQGYSIDYLKELSNNLGLDNRIIFLGFRNDINKIYPTADIFALPSKREGLGIAAIEAMSSGLPIITSNIHGINDYSINGVTGYSCSPLNINGFKNSIINLKNDSELRKVMGENNVNMAKKFDISIIYPMYEELYKKINE